MDQTTVRNSPYAIGDDGVGMRPNSYDARYLMCQKLLNSGLSALQIQEIVNAKKMQISEESTSQPEESPRKPSEDMIDTNPLYPNSALEYQLPATYSPAEPIPPQGDRERDGRYSKPYKCKLCEKSFSTPGYLDTHMRLHTGVKPYTCRICHRGFAQRPGYTYHMRTHSGEMRYQCKICFKKFIQIGTLKRHCDTHGIPAKNVEEIIIRLNPTNTMPIPKPLEKEPSLSPDFSTKSVSPSWRPLSTSSQSFPPSFFPNTSLPNLRTQSLSFPIGNPLNTASFLQMQNMMTNQRGYHQPLVQSNSAPFLLNPISQYQAMLQYQQYCNLINAASK
ncbi:Oidioi.mRNA.OKI2018_I69.chr1.g2335.t1.cds [Oikopleura dioica]|uniref:Oidioi.mRNA.OKI2018_I69.chr1.g2335.t1.cds n=1 Tax=Oikopleura dioica TaxID=34765 RepID=A0ABN7SV31_OIKDI|nr:Oidioi.mRNA.OKI2018_I69.chr1.g2335.t1.cds [Oikopleura dioica]